MGRPWYSFDVGAWHIVSLNLNCDKLSVGGCGPGSAQETWLRQDLAEHRSSCVMAFWHEPHWSSGSHGNASPAAADQQRIGFSTTFIEDLYAAGADLILTAHDHGYERFAPQDPSGRADFARGLRQFVVGTGGKSLDPFLSVQPNSEVRSFASYGVLKLTLRPTAYDWQFVPDRAGGFTDGGSQACH